MWYGPFMCCWCNYGIDTQRLNKVFFLSFPMFFPVFVYKISSDYSKKPMLHQNDYKTNRSNKIYKKKPISIGTCIFHFNLHSIAVTVTDCLNTWYRQSVWWLQKLVLISHRFPGIPVSICDCRARFPATLIFM